MRERYCVADLHTILYSDCCKEISDYEVSHSIILVIFGEIQHLDEEI